MSAVSICIPRYVIFRVGSMILSGASGTPSSVKVDDIVCMSCPHWASVGAAQK